MHAVYPSIFREGARLLLPKFKQLVLITVIQCEVRLKVPLYSLYSILFIRTGIVGPFCIVQSTYFSLFGTCGICGSVEVIISRFMCVMAQKINYKSKSNKHKLEQSLTLACACPWYWSARTLRRFLWLVRDWAYDVTNYAMDIYFSFTVIILRLLNQGQRKRAILHVSLMVNFSLSRSNPHFLRRTMYSGSPKTGWQCALSLWNHSVTKCSVGYFFSLQLPLLSSSS